jgi:hypothetical protein
MHIIKIVIAKYTTKLKSLDSSADASSWTAKESEFKKCLFSP